MRHVISTCFGLLLIQQLSAEPELKGSPTELAAYLVTLPKTVSVAGDSEIKVQADRAIINLKVTSENKSLQEALRVNQEIRNKILNSLKDRDISTDRILASKFSSTPKYGMFSDKAKSYRVENIIKVTVRDEKEFQATAHLVDAFAEVQYLGIDFEHSDKEALKKKALAQALDDAADRKKVFEEKLGVKLMPKGFRGLSASEHDSIRRQPASRTGTVSGLLADPAFKVVTQSLSMNETGSSFDEIVFSAQVAVEYMVESK